LLTEFVTDLRAAVHNASDGKPIDADPLLLRAQLARLLRQAGQVAEAQSGAKDLLKALEKYPLPPGQKIDDSPAATEIKAAGLEAMGDDAYAAEAYAHRVELVARTWNGELNPGWISWLQDWWISRAYAQCVVRSGQSAAIEDALRAKLANASPRGEDRLAQRVPRTLLAAILEAQGNGHLAQTQWQALLPQADEKAASLPASQENFFVKSGG
jgi:hypothetical protein